MTVTTLSQNIKSIRKSKELNQKQLASLAGIRIATLCDIEKGNSVPSFSTLEKIAQALDCSFDAISSGVETSPSSPEDGDMHLQQDLLSSFDPIDACAYVSSLSSAKMDSFFAHIPDFDFAETTEEDMLYQMYLWKIKQGTVYVPQIVRLWDAPDGGVVFTFPNYANPALHCHLRVFYRNTAYAMFAFGSLLDKLPDVYPDAFDR